MVPDMLREGVLASEAVGKVGRKERRETGEQDVLCGDNDSVLGRHARCELGAHHEDEFLEVVAMLPGVVCNGDRLRRSNQRY